jgi:putative transposase
MREQRLLQRHRPLRRRRRLGFFRVERPDQLWHMDMTSEGGRARLVLPERRDRLLHARDRRLVARTALPRRGSDRGHRARQRSARDRDRHAHARAGQRHAYTSRAFRACLKELGIVHRRGGYRDPESQAFIESFFSKLTERVVWRHEFEALDDARRVIGDYIDQRYPNRPHSRLGYRTPLEVSQTWEDGRALVKQAA